MKHLKPFNEAVGDTFKEELQDFCETNLAYLLDEEDTKINVTELTSFIEVELTLNSKKWTEIKDHIIPFVTRLQNNYIIKGIDIIFVNSWKETSILTINTQDLINENPRYSKDLQTDYINIFQFYINKYTSINTPK